MWNMWQINVIIYFWRGNEALIFCDNFFMDLFECSFYEKMNSLFDILASVINDFINLLSFVESACSVRPLYLLFFFDKW